MKFCDTNKDHASVSALAVMVCVTQLMVCLFGASGSLAAEPQVGKSQIAEPQTGRSRSGAIERVTAGTPSRKTLTITTTQPGSIHAFEEAPLQPRVAGYVKTVMVDIGDHVERGQVLMEIDAPELIDEVAQHKALVAQAIAGQMQARAAVAAAEASVRTARANMAGVEARVARGEADLQRWKAEYDRMKELSVRGTVNPKLVDETLNQYRSAEAAKDEASAQVEATTAEIEEAEANVQKAEADAIAAAARIDVAKANLARAETIAGYLQVRAPFDGVITQRNVDAGHSVSPAIIAGTKPLLVVARDDKVRVFTEIPELEAEWVTAANAQAGGVADPATVTIQGLNHRAFETSVTRTAWSLDPGNRTLRTELDIANEDGTLRPGMYAMVAIELEKRENVLSLPVTAIVREGNTARCCAVVDEKIVFRELKLGIRGGDDFEIISGVTANDTVVLTRAGSLLDGQPVEVLPPAGS